ncbi:MAG: iron ABC transporter permease [Sedimentisphaerales bacterium]|nr:iron ABC transporter permease [Sedimentisphaerales bacterium]
MNLRSVDIPLLTARKLLFWAGLLLLATVVCVGVYSFIGGAPIGDGRFWASKVWQLRVFRLLAGAVVGSALAVAGMALQGLMRNPLAEPYVLGLSSGAGVGVLLGPLLAQWTIVPDWLSAPLLALAGALLTAIVVYAVAQRHGFLNPYVLLLSGVIVNVFNGALILVILQFVKQTDMIQFIGWGMGKLPEWLWFESRLLWLCGAVTAGGWAVIFLRGASLNALGLGDEVAASSGVAVSWLRVELFIVIALMTSAAVSLAGPVGFVGLIIPHACRLMVGPDHRLLTIISGFVGAIFLMTADTACRLLGEAIKVGELPVGVITALVGGPVFILMLRRREGKGQL